MSDNILFSFESSLFYFRIGIFGLLVSYTIDKDKKFLNYFFYSLIITFSLTIFYAFIIYIFKLNPHPVRISSFFGDELILGSYLLRLLPLIIGLFFIRKNKSNLEKYLFIIFLVFTYIAIILSGERAAFFYINISILFILVFVRINFKLLFPIIIVSIASFSILYLSLDYNKTGRLLFQRYTISVFDTMNLISFLKKDEKTSTKLDNTAPKLDKIIFFTKGHESLYRTAFNMFLDRPIIGHGPKMFRVKCSDPNYSEGVAPCMTHPHNFYIQLLSETGIIGFSFLFSLFIYVIFLSIKYFYYNYIKKKKLYSNYQICLLACLLITVWPIVPNGNFFNNYLMILYSLPLGFFKKN